MTKSRLGVQQLLVLSLIGAACPGIAAENSLVVVVNSGDSTASVYSAVRISTGDPSLKLLKVLPVGKTPNEVCVAPDGKRAYVSNRGDISVTVIDLDSVTVASTISEPTMINPDGCAVNPEGTKLYVPAAGAGSA